MHQHYWKRRRRRDRGGREGLPVPQLWAEVAAVSALFSVLTRPRFRSGRPNVADGDTDDDADFETEAGDAWDDVDDEELEAKEDSADDGRDGGLSTAGSLGWFLLFAGAALAGASAPAAFAWANLRCCCRCFCCLCRTRALTTASSCSSSREFSRACSSSCSPSCSSSSFCWSLGVPVPVPLSEAPRSSSCGCCCRSIRSFSIRACSCNFRDAFSTSIRSCSSSAALSCGRCRSADADLAACCLHFILWLAVRFCSHRRRAFSLTDDTDVTLELLAVVMVERDRTDA